MMFQRSIRHHLVFWALCAIAVPASPALAGLNVRDMGGRSDGLYTPNPIFVPIMQTNYGTSGNTSVRNNGLDELANHWKSDVEDGYYQRNRDLGQVFTPETTFRLDAIVLRTGPANGAVRYGAPGAPVFIQFFEVIGEPTINDNGTPTPPAEHGFNMSHARVDDYIEGVTYSPLAVIEGGTFPNIPRTRDINDDPTGDDAGKRRWMRWDLTDDDEGMLFEAGKRYGFLVGFSEEGSAAAGNRAFTLLNDNSATSNSDAPSLTDDRNPYPGGWGIRREGDGTLPPWRWTLDGIDKGGADDPAADSEAITNPPSDPTDNDVALSQSRFVRGGGGDRLYTTSPSSDGWPDVDTYRDHVFYIEIAPDHSLSAVKDAYVEGGGEADSVQDIGRLAARTDKGRKAWMGFDTSTVEKDVLSAELVLTAAGDLDNVESGSALEVYGLTDSSLDGWDEAALTFSNAPGNDTTSGWALLADKTELLGSIDVGPIDAAGDVVRIELSAEFFNADANDVASLILVMRDASTPDAGRSTAWFYSKDATGGAGPVLNLNVVPEPGSLAILGLGGLVVSSRRRRR